MSSRDGSIRRASTIDASPVNASQLGAILDLIADGTISGKIAKDLFEIVWSEGGDPRAVVEARGMKQVTDLGAIEKVVNEIIAANPDKVADAKTNPKALGWFVGQVMKSSGGKANPQTVNDILKTQARSLAGAARANRSIQHPTARFDAQLTAHPCQKTGPSRTTFGQIAIVAQRCERVCRPIARESAVPIRALFDRFSALTECSRVVGAKVFQRAT